MSTFRATNRTLDQSPILAVIGGSGLYEMPGLHNTKEAVINTPFGEPSAPVIVGILDDQPVAFLARHGIGHHITPSEVNFRANIYALKSLGVERIVSISAVGSLREDFHPGEIVIPDQVVDFTRNRKRTFFSEGLVVHISLPDPFCAELSTHLREATIRTGVTVHNGGSLITIEGPRFSTRAESNLYRLWGMSIIGMTTSPEAFLAREAEMCYAVMAHVTDYDVWHVSEEPVTVEMIIDTLHRNTQVAQQAIRNLVGALDGKHQCSCGSALANAMITRPDVIPTNTRQKLGLLVDKYLKS